MAEMRMTTVIGTIVVVSIAVALACWWRHLWTGYRSGLLNRKNMN